MSKLKVVFAGTPPFAAHALKKLHLAGHEIALVMTQPDRPAGRGMKLQASAVKQIALDLGFKIAQPSSLKLDGKYSDEAMAAKNLLEDLDFDVMGVAAYGLILPQWTLDLAQSQGRIGCLNIHASLLPRWRGAAPIQRAIWAGDQKTGNCIMKMDVGLDTGPIVLCEALDIHATDTTASLHDRLAIQGADLLIRALDAYMKSHTLSTTPQQELGMCYAEKISKAEAGIDWAQDGQWIDRQIRALNPMPGAWAKWQDEHLKIWVSEYAGVRTLGGQVPGQIIEIDDLGILVQCGQGCIRVLELQKPGGKKQAATQFAKQHQLHVGDIFLSANS